MEPSFLVFLQKSPFNMVLFGTAIVSGAMLVWPLFGRIAGGAVPQVGAFEAVNLINRRDAAVIDTRDQAEFAAGERLEFVEVALREGACAGGELVEEVEHFLRRLRHLRFQRVVREGGKAEQAGEFAAQVLAELTPNYK